MKNFTIYHGPSLIDGSPIIGVVTLKTSNEKTGDMAQLWILRSDMTPTAAVQKRADVSICGGCKHRHNNGGACYVQPFQAPRSIFESWGAGKYDNLTNDRAAVFERLNGKGIRLGAYGDPAALPDHVLALLTDAADYHTGYTHQWKNKRLQHALKYCMASVDNARDIVQLKRIDPAAGYFLVTDNDKAPADAIECLADSKGLTCSTCKACDGSSRAIYINVHGTRKKRFTAQIDIIEV